LVYALIREANSDAPPFSTSILKGLDKENKPLRNYRSLNSIRAYAAQETILSFDDLKDNTQYQVFITAASILPYDNAINLYEDQQVI
jgi:hypothetical protein